MDITYNSSSKPRVIFFAPILEYPPAGGPQISVINAIKVLNKLTELHILTTIPLKGLGDKEAEIFIRKNCYSLSQVPSSKIYSKYRLANRVLNKVKVVFRPIVSKIDSSFIARYAKQNNINIIWVDRVIEHAFGVFVQIKKLLPEAKIVADTESVYSRFVLRELPYISNPIRKFRIRWRGKNKIHEEHFICENADVITAVSDLDAEYFKTLTIDSRRVMLFSNTIDTDLYTAPVPCPDFISKKFVVLIGSFGHVNSPMDRAAKWLADEIMPIVLQQIPEAHLVIVGRNADITQADTASSAITIVGKVPSMLPFLKNAIASLVPLKHESGTRFKILESGAASVSCISTTLGAEGIDVTDGDNIIIADTAESFADGIIKMYMDDAFSKKIASRLHELIMREYSLERQLKDGENILKFITANK